MENAATTENAATRATTDTELRIADGVAWVTIMRERRGNSFRLETVLEMERAVIEAGDAPGVRVLVLTGEGDRFFSTGGDVADYNERYNGDVVAFRTYQRAIERLLTAILHCPKPVIARVNGTVAGGANAFHLAADLVLAVHHATFQQVGTRIGSMSGLGPAQWWPLVIGDRRARDLLLTARPITAATAAEWGAVTLVGTAEEVDAAIADYARQFGEAFPEALRYTRVALNGDKERALREITHSREWLTLHFSGTESVEGFASFVRKEPVDSAASWECVDRGGTTVAPWGRAGARCGTCGSGGLPESHIYCGVCGAKVAS